MAVAAGDRLRLRPFAQNAFTPPMRCCGGHDFEPSTALKRPRSVRELLSGEICRFRAGIFGTVARAARSRCESGMDDANFLLFCSRGFSDGCVALRSRRNGDE